ncbi:hypothetical protein SEA_ESTES_99 [Mycobacterium phage Estes]|uniref:Uncharacterized protein n=2 Tax=Reyvirus TaxID=1623301 RepID=A0A7G9A2G9_9CAUD|nr:hypothetical protein J4U03_gp099 [Mycobacterium phage Estes]YP_010014006.1 hypothetical protein J4U04_gp100 [Mycobacterium phage MrMagoo]APQ42203.1 hypothetical protein PBI_MRMAGOO_100 [Mycobacterium phage MrMagoo]ARM70277.1 hypothetical protein SEA_GARDENSALSA_99 [Mycobacterium phage GardenSalsa]QNL30808.1 hypothetical protein SEA_ESTES_99 [Mycobacterium phage Estes]
MTTRQDKARKKFRQTRGYNPSESQLTSYMATLPATFYDSGSYDSGSSSSYDSGSSYCDSGSSFSDGGSCSF